MPARTCAFVACTCPVENGDAYCSSACRERGDERPEDPSACGCGHLECAGDRGLQEDVEGKAARIAEEPSEA